MLVTFYFLLRSNSVTTPSKLSKLFSAGLIDKKRKTTNKQTNWLYTFRLLNFIFHHHLITYNSTTLTLILKFLPFLQHLTYDFQIGNAMRFFRNASKTQYSGRKKVILRGRAQKMCVHHPRKKWRRSPIKINLLISDAPEIKWVSCLCFHSEHTGATLKCHSMYVV